MEKLFSAKAEAVIDAMIEREGELRRAIEAATVRMWSGEPMMVRIHSDDWNVGAEIDEIPRLAEWNRLYSLLPQPPADPIKGHGISPSLVRP